jgi:hypothetical protein
MMTLKEEISTMRQTLIREAGAYCFEHPEETFASVAVRFGMSEAWVSQAARSMGLKPRARGRKKKVAQA